MDTWSTTPSASRAMRRTLRPPLLAELGRRDLAATHASGGGGRSPPLLLAIRGHMGTSELDGASRACGGQAPQDRRRRRPRGRAVACGLAGRLTPRGDRGVGLEQEVGGHRHTCSERTCHVLCQRIACTAFPQHKLVRGTMHSERGPIGFGPDRKLAVDRGAPASRSSAPQEFKLLRPNSLLCTNCKSFSRTLLRTHPAEQIPPCKDSEKGFQCA